MAAKKDKKKQGQVWRPATRLVHEGTLRSQFGETSEAIFLNSGYVYDNAEQAERRFKGDEEGFVYSRYSNPTVDMFEKRMCALEGAEAARGTASGMAAVNASLFSFLKAGDHVVSARALFGSCRYIVEDLLPRFGVQTTLIDGRDLSAWEAAMRPNTRAVFFETPTNPVLELVDIEAVSKIAHKVGALVVVDNVFATPMLQRPIPLGVDIVVYSATKHIDGQGRCLGGVVLGTKDFIEDKLHTFLKQTGPSLSPFNAWVLLKALETLPLRVERHGASAAAIADFLAERKEVVRVFYPGPRRSSAKRARQAADGWGRSHGRFRGEGWEARGLPFHERAPDLQDHQQSRRRQEPRHAPFDHHASAAEARATRRARHFRPERAPLHRA